MKKKPKTNEPIKNVTNKQKVKIVNKVQRPNKM